MYPKWSQTVRDKEFLVEIRLSPRSPREKWWRKWRSRSRRRLGFVIFRCCNEERFLLYHIYIHT